MRRSSVLITGIVLLAACGGGGGGGGSNPPPGEAETFYVNPDGSDDNDGLAPDRPFRTLFHAVDGLTAGDVVYVAPGTYPLLPHAPGEPLPAEVAEFADIEGTTAQPVSFIADITGEKTLTDPGEVVIDGTNQAIGLRVSRSTNIIIDGFHVIRTRVNNGAGIQVRSDSNNATVRNCVISQSGDGIRVENANDVLIFNNLIYDNDNRGIRISNGSVRARIINNTIVNNENRGVAIGGANAQNVAPTGATLRNNLIQNNSNVSISIEDGPPSALEGYTGNFNLVFYAPLADQTKTYRPTTIVGANDVNEDAALVDPGDGDFHLQPTSPAIDAGTGNIGDALLAMLFDRATTADGVPDDPPVDIGYHYPAQ